MTTAQPLAESAQIRVLVVDDSATARAVLSRSLAADPQIEVVGVARDGEKALERIKSLRPDVVTLDVEMPGLNGLDTLARIMRECPTPVVMVSAQTRHGADTTIRALELGAVDFVLKPVYGGVAALHEVSLELSSRVKLAAGARPRTPAAARRRAGAGSATFGHRPCSIVVIGASTGGPGALRTVLGGLPPDLPVPVVIVQHMPPEFTRSLAARLDELSPLPVKEARDGDALRPGRVLLAPGDRHLVIANGFVQLTGDPPECGVRPSVNVTLASAARRYGAGTLGVILTGMGSDGTRGAGVVKAVGGVVLAEAESTCVVFGMPRSVQVAGYADEMVPLPEMAAAIARLCGARRTLREAPHG